MKPKKKPVTLEALYPNARARRAADAAIDALPTTSTTLAAALDIYDEAYVQAGGKSPWRKP